jgi:hypothetical protein
MATKTPVRPSLTDAQLQELMSLLRGSDSVELKLTVPPVQQRAAIEVRRRLRRDSAPLYRAHAPDGIELDDLAVLGPIFVLKLKWQPRDFARKMVAELWLYPNGDRIFELSTKCLPSEASEGAAEARFYLSKHGIDLSGEQQTKTRTALEFFSGERAD